jgi:hypothetical protein
MSAGPALRWTADWLKSLLLGSELPAMNGAARTRSFKALVDRIDGTKSCWIRGLVRQRAASRRSWICECFDPPQLRRSASRRAIGPERIGTLAISTGVIPRRVEISNRG